MNYLRQEFKKRWVGGGGKMGGVGLTNFISGIQRVEIFATYNLSLRSESSSK